jgi:hypothetical protein
MSEIKHMSLSYKAIWLIWLLAAVSVVQAQHPGDYRSRYGGINFSSPSGWQVYGADGWSDAIQAPASPFAQDLYLEQMASLDIDFRLVGSLFMGNRGSLTIASGKSLVIENGGRLALSSLTVNGNGRLVNHGQIFSAKAGAQLTLDPLGSVGSTLENYGTIELLDDNKPNTYNLYLNSNARLISGPQGRIIGDGSASTNASGVYFEIANAGGFDEAFQLAGTNSYKQAHYLFNGTSNQVCGASLPDPVFSITVNNPATFKLSKDIALNPWQNACFHIVSGSTVDMGTNIIYSQNWGNASFQLDENATILTAHPDGISSETLYQKIYLGCIQTNDATYSSGANYGYNGSEPQVSGNFETTPQGNTINDLIVTNTNGLTLSNPLNVTGSVYGGEYIENGDTLPVTLTSFTAFAEADSRVLLSWTTQSETNCYGFYVHRSSVNDLSKAQRVSRLIDANNSSQGGFYVFKDEEIERDGIYYYWLEDISFGSESTFHGPVYVLVNGGYTPPAPDQDNLTGLNGIYPNPFNPSTSLSYTLAQQADVQISIYNSKGQLVDRLQKNSQAKGRHTLVWNAGRLALPSGVYFVRFCAGTTTETRKLVLSK